MGREIRHVIPNWEHPRDEKGDYIPMYDSDYETKAQEWIAEFTAWENHTHPDWEKYGAEYSHYWEWDGDPPDRESYRPDKWTTEQATWIQMYETVSEGTPVSPAFATKEELIEYLVRYGDYWDQKRGHGGWLRENAEQFVQQGYAPSFIMMASETGNKMFAPRDGDPLKA